MVGEYFKRVVSMTKSVKVELLKSPELMNKAEFDLHNQARLMPSV